MISLSPLLFLFLAPQGLDPSGFRHTAPLSDYVALSISADREVYYVGDVVRLTLRATNSSESAVLGHFDLDPARGEPWLEYRSGGTDFRELRVAMLRAKGRQKTLEPGEHYDEEADLSLTERASGSRRFLLEKPGAYEFRATYHDSDADPNGVLISNILRIDVVAPPSDEAAASAVYSPDLAYVAQFRAGVSVLSMTLTRAAADFVTTFSGSRYAIRVREGLLRSLAYRIRQKRATAEEKATYEALTSDTIPPVLALMLSPSVLWPPDHKLVQISALVNVTDALDPSPSVTLVSVNCNDGCNPQADIVGADLGTDDRFFDFRAERRGLTPGGRTYTVTYSATDAAGNKSTTNATVTVPHSQGK